MRGAIIVILALLVGSYVFYWSGTKRNLFKDLFNDTFRSNKRRYAMSKIYKAEYADGEMEVFSYCDNDKEAMEEAESYEDEHGIVFNLFEVDENYDEIRTVY